jgi:hypothetical protein
MKPQLLIQNLDTIGKNNGGIGKAIEVLDKAKAWKRQRIIRLRPAGETIPTKVADTHENLIFPPNNGVVRMSALGMEVGEAYSTAIEQILAHPVLKDWEYLLTIEHDNMPEPDGVIKLLAHMEEHPEYDCIGGLYFVKGPGAPAQIWGDPKDPILNFRPQLPDPNGGLVECCGTGMGFNLWRLSMFKNKKLRKPWFKTQKEGGTATQDLYAWSDFRKHGIRCAIACDVKVGHYDSETDTVY